MGLSEAVHAVVIFDQQLPIEVSSHRQPFTRTEYRAARCDRAYVGGLTLFVGVDKSLAAFGMRLDLNTNL
jgi:hypothetical protein